MAATLTPCPAAPAAYTGTDPVVAAVTQLDADTVASCQATADRLDQLHADVAPLDGDVGAVKNAVNGVDTDVQAVKASVDAVKASTDSITANPLAVAVQNFPPASTTAQTVELGPNAQAQVDGDVQALHDDFWWAVGLFLGGLMIWLVWKAVGPRWLA